MQISQKFRKENQSKPDPTWVTFVNGLLPPPVDLLGVCDQVRLGEAALGVGGNLTVNTSNFYLVDDTVDSIKS